MGRDISVYAEYRDKKTLKWNIVPIKVRRKTYVPSDPEQYPQVYDRVEFEWWYAQPWTGRNSELFDILDCNSNSYDSILSYPRGLPVDISPEVKEEHEHFKRKDGDGYYSFSENWLTLAELKCALLDKKKYPKWYKYEDEDGVKQKEEGPRVYLKNFVRSIDHFVGVFDWLEDTEVRIVYWFDW